MAAFHGGTVQGDAARALWGVYPIPDPMNPCPHTACQGYRWANLGGVDPLYNLRVVQTRAERFLKAPLSAETIDRKERLVTHAECGACAGRRAASAPGSTSG
jgi:hypothetical protein